MAELLNRHYANGVGTTGSTVFTAPAHSSSGTINRSVVCSMVICNTHTADVTVDAVVTPAGTTTEISILKSVIIKAGNSLEGIQSRLFLQHNGTNADTLKVICNTGSHVDVLVSTLEGVN